MVEGIRRLGDIDHFFRGVWATSCVCCCVCLCAEGLVLAVADLELPIAGS